MLIAQVLFAAALQSTAQVPEVTRHGFFLSDVMKARYEISQSAGIKEVEFTEAENLALFQIWLEGPRPTKERLSEDLKFVCGILQKHWIASGIVDVRFGDATMADTDKTGGIASSWRRINCATGVFYAH